MYASLAELKQYLGSSLPLDDALLTRLLSATQAMIDRYCQRRFEALSEVRSFTIGVDTHGPLLELGDDLFSITEIRHRMDDGGPGVLVSLSDVVTLPAHKKPYYALRLSRSGLSWQYVSEPYGAVSVEGVFAFSDVAPEDVKQAAVRLAAYLYRQKDAQVFDVVAQPEFGVMTVPQGLPKDVRILLDLYRRVW
jgi:hypothetical protein